MTKLTHIFQPKILRKYDIRGIVDKDLTANDAFAIGFAFTRYLIQQSLEPTIAVLKDARPSGIKLKEALIKGIIEAGGTAIDCGTGPSPLCYFASHHLNTSGFVTVTGSHNPLEYNGFKLGITGKAFTEEEILRIATIAENGVEPMEGGSCIQKDITRSYILRLMQDLNPPKHLKFGFNALNGASGEIVKHIAKNMNAMEFECEMDANLSTVPDPSNPQNIARMQGDLHKHGLDAIFAFDGDADRIMAVTANKILQGEDILLLCARDVLSKEKGAVIFDVKCSNSLAHEITKHGGKPIMYKTGHSLIKKKMLEENAVLAGECSGHIYFKQGYYGFDDGIYTAIRLLSHFAKHDFQKEITTFPETIKSPEMKIPSEHKFDVVSHLQKILKERSISFNDIDGVRAEISPTSWFLVRASNTEEAIIVRYEAKTPSEFSTVKQTVESLLKEVL